MKEVWKDISFFEDAYQVSNLGNLRSKTRERYMGFGKYANIKGQILKATLDKEGYHIAKLCKNAKYTYYKVHRLVMQLFVGKQPKDNPQVNHKDGCKQNNSVMNLEWVSPSDNMKHAYRNNLRKPIVGLKGSKNPNAVAVLQYTVSGKFVQRFDTITEASKKIKVVESCIRGACGGRQKTSGGFIWKRA